MRLSVFLMCVIIAFNLSKLTIFANASFKVLLFGMVSSLRNIYNLSFAVASLELIICFVLPSRFYSFLQS